MIYAGLMCYGYGIFLAAEGNVWGLLLWISFGTALIAVSGNEPETRRRK